MIYKYEHKPISRANRSGGSKSAVACAAYRAGAKITDPATGKIYDYTKKSGILHSAIIVPEGEAKIPRAELWAAADAAEKRRDARVAREIVGALDPDLTLADNIALVQRHAHRLADKYGCAVDYAIHAPSRSGDQRNLHVHFLLTTRRLEHGKLTQKTDLELNDKALAKAGKPSGRAQIKTLREDWQDDINAALERAGKKYRVDARSYQEQGLDIMPGIHLGPEATRAERRGERTERGDYNRLVETINILQAELARREAEAQRQQAEKQQETTDHDDRRDYRNIADSIDDNTILDAPDITAATMRDVQISGAAALPEPAQRRPRDADILPGRAATDTLGLQPHPRHVQPVPGPGAGPGRANLTPTPKRTLVWHDYGQPLTPTPARHTEPEPAQEQQQEHANMSWTIYTGSLDYHDTGGDYLRGCLYDLATREADALAQRIERPDGPTLALEEGRHRIALTPEEGTLLHAALDARARREGKTPDPDRPRRSTATSEPTKPQPPQQTEPSAYKADGMTLEERRRAEHAATLAAAGLDKRKPAATKATNERGGRG